MRGALSEISNLSALAIYCLISVVLFGLPVLSSPAAAHVGFMSDPSAMIWCMVWWPYALLHGLNPFITRQIWAPIGYNLTWATSIPAIAIVFSPFTAAFGPVVSYNLAALAAPGLSAWTAFLLCRRITRNLGAAFGGGLLYGFSPYEVGHVLGGHLSLSAVFVPPLCVMMVLRQVEGSISCLRFAAYLTLLLVLQGLLSSEILATMTLFGAVALLIAFAVIPARRGAILDLTFPVACSYGAAVLLLSPFLYFALAHGAVPKQIFPLSFFSADVLSFFVPGELMLVQPPGTASIASRFIINLWENSSYFSIPLVVLAGFYFWSRRREPSAILLMLTLLFVAVASLGPVLLVGGRQVMTMPWSLASSLPLIRHAMPVRFSNYAFIILAVIVSIFFAGPRFPFGKALTAALIIGLFPNPLFLFQQSRYGTPSFFTQGLYRDYLKRGDNVLVIPYGFSGPSMAWQAESSMYFRMPGGYINVIVPGDFSRWPLLSMLTNLMPVPDAADQFRAFIANYKVDAVILADSATKPARDLPASLRLQPERIGGILLYRTPPNLRLEPPAAARLTEFQQSTANAWFAQMLCSAGLYIAGGHPLADLSPPRMYELGLLPESKWSRSLDQAFAAHGAVNGLWVGPGENGTITVGLPAWPAAIGPLLSRYGADAASILYPYPDRYYKKAPSDDEVHYLVMTLRPGALTRCGH